MFPDKKRRVKTLPSQLSTAYPFRPRRRSYLILMPQTNKYAFSGQKSGGRGLGTASAAEKARFRAAVEPLYARFGEQSGLLQRIRES